MPQQLFPDDVRATLPALYANETLGDGAPVRVKFFTPWAGWTWYATEFDGVDTFFGLVSGQEIELGYFSLSELAAVRGPGGLRIERDEHLGSLTLAEARAREEGNR